MESKLLSDKDDMKFPTPTYPDIAQKVVVVTGGASGIGFAMADTFIRHGAGVMLIDVNEAEMNKAGRPSNRWSLVLQKFMWHQ